jgi:AAA ATPase domain
LALMLVQRDEELAAIERLLGAVEGGDGGVVLLEDPAGIGKTVLLQAACDRAEAIGLAVLHARGGELERAAAYHHHRRGFPGSSSAPAT